MKIKQNTIDSTIGRLYNSTNKQTNKQKYNSAFKEVDAILMR